MQHRRMARSCIALAVLAALLFVLGAPVGRLVPFVLGLACPVMMLVMMRGMHGGHGDHAHDDPAAGDARASARRGSG